MKTSLDAPPCVKCKRGRLKVAASDVTVQQCSADGRWVAGWEHDCGTPHARVIDERAAERLVEDGAEFWLASEMTLLDLSDFAALLVSPSDVWWSELEGGA